MNKFSKIVILLILAALLIKIGFNVHHLIKTKYEWQSTACQPQLFVKGNENVYCVEFVRGDIITLEGIPATLPFGGSSGRWGDSGKSWTSQHGTPIGADVIYYAGYEDKFYHLKTDFSVEEMKKAVDTTYQYYDDNYEKFSGLIFGFCVTRHGGGLERIWSFQD